MYSSLGTSIKADLTHGLLLSSVFALLLSLFPWHCFPKARGGSCSGAPSLKPVGWGGMNGSEVTAPVKHHSADEQLHRVPKISLMQKYWCLEERIVKKQIIGVPVSEADNLITLVHKALVPYCAVTS